MSCNCQHRAAESPEQIVSKTRKATVKFCDVCDPCNEAVTNVRICAFVVPTLEEGRYFKNSFIFVQEDDSVYFISDDRSEIPFGSRPKFIEDFDPTATDIHYKSTVVYDVKNKAGYVYDPEGNRMTIALTAAPFSSLTAGDGMVVTADGGNYTVAIDPTAVASADGLRDVTLLVTNHTSQINNLTDSLASAVGDIETLEDSVAHVHDLVDDANELAIEAKTNAAAAQQTANDAMSAVNNKQDKLTAGDNITIQNNVISAGVPNYGRATTSENGLMSTEDRKQTKNTGFYKPGAPSTSASEVTLNFTKTVSDENGSTYTETSEAVTIPAAAAQTAGVMTAADKAKLDGIDLSTKQDTLTAGDNITIRNNTISAASGMRTLTSADNNYTSPDNKDGIALWLLPGGVYKTSGAVALFVDTTSATTSSNTELILAVSQVDTRAIVSVLGPSELLTYVVDVSSGRGEVYGRVSDSLLSTNKIAALSANQGRVLKSLIDALDARVAALEGN